VSLSAEAGSPLSGGHEGQLEATPVTLEIVSANRDHAPRGAFFCASVEEARGGDPSGWIGVKQLAVQRVWGCSALVGGSSGHAAPPLMGRTA
ncbi:MAG: hypothetical protein WA662_19605, partial [Pseudolabrys sp.]